MDQILFCDEGYNTKSDSPPKISNFFQINGGEDKPPVKAFKDIQLLQDERVLANLLRSEEVCIPSSKDYLRHLQPHLNSSMRKIVTEWMLQVSQECECAPDVFMLAVNYMDRFLAKVPNVQKNHLQLLGSVCLMISSKFKETVPLRGETLIEYTADSYTAQEIRDWELFVLKTLEWEIASVTPMDFTDHILQRILPCIEKQLWQEHLEELKLRIETVLALAVTEYTFSYLNPSLLTGSAVKLVLSRFQLTCHDFIEEPSIDFKLCQSICTHSKHIEVCKRQLNEIIHQLEKVVPNYLLRFAVHDKSTSQPNSHSDYASSIASSTADHNLPSEMNDSCILVS